MRTLANTAERQDSCDSGMLAILGAAFQRALAAFIAWRVQQAAIAYLQSMSDRELRDIELSRAEIEFAVTGEHGWSAQPGMVVVDPHQLRLPADRCQR